MSTQTCPAVLAGVDGSAESLAALEVAATEAARRHQPLRVICAYLWPLVASAAHLPSAVPLDSPRSAPQHMLDDAVAAVRARHPRLAVSTEVIVGPVGDVLRTESAFASVLVVGHHDHGRLLDALTGSVAADVAASSRCPVVIVGPEARPYGHATGPVVVGVDGAEYSQAAVQFAFEEAAARRCSLTAVCVWAEPAREPRDAWLPVAYEFDHAHRTAVRVLAEAVAGYEERYPQVPVFRETIRSTQPATVLVDASREAGLLVVGSRGRGSVTASLLGSVGRDLANHARCPVAIVRPLA